MTSTENLRIVIFKEDGVFVAQCLEYDVCTQASDFETAKERIECLIEVELNAGQAIDPAPERFHNMWPDASVTEAGNHQYGTLEAA